MQEIDQLISLSRLLIAQSGQLANFSTLAKQISVSVDTIRRWLDVLESFYFSYRIRPWFKNVGKSLRKQPKIYPTDWSAVADPGAHCECFVAGHLLKAVNHWTDCGLGKFALHYLRDTDQREVDFLIARDGVPWMLVEVKKSAKDPIGRGNIGGRLPTAWATRRTACRKVRVSGPRTAMVRFARRSLSTAAHISRTKSSTATGRIA